MLGWIPSNFLPWIHGIFPDKGSEGHLEAVFIKFYWASLAGTTRTGADHCFLGGAGEPDHIPHSMGVLVSKRCLRGRRGAGGRAQTEAPPLLAKPCPSPPPGFRIPMPGLLRLVCRGNGSGRPRPQGAAGDSSSPLLFHSPAPHSPLLRGLLFSQTPPAGRVEIARGEKWRRGSTQGPRRRPLSRLCQPPFSAALICSVSEFRLTRQPAAPFLSAAGPLGAFFPRILAAKRLDFMHSQPPKRICMRQISHQRRPNLR